MRAGWISAPVLVVVLSVLVACGGERAVPNDPVPVPATTSPLPAAPAGPAPGAARDVTGYLARPCDLLGAEQAGRLGLRGPGPLRLDTGAVIGCGWLRGPSGDVGEVHLEVEARDPVGEAYRSSSPSPGRTLTETQVGDLPAVVIAPIDTYVRCELSVRTDAGQGFAVSVRQSSLEVPEACALARSVADTVVPALPRRAG